VTLPASRGGLAWLAVLLLLGAFVAFQVGRQVYASWSIGQEADRIRTEIAAVEAENATLGRELAYLRSDAYISAEARRLLNLGRLGEHVLIIPPGAEAALPPALQEQTTSSAPLIEQWLDLFFGP
jgi:cell division protein FtsB